MGNVIFIKDRKVCVKPLRSRLEDHQQFQKVVDVMESVIDLQPGNCQTKLML